VARGRTGTLTGTVVAVTGGARGIGRATTEALVARGARVAIGDLGPGVADQAAAEIGGGTLGFELDVTDRDSFTRFLDDAESGLGALDVLVNNAGIMHVGPFLEQDDAAAARQTDVNLHGVMFGMRLALLRMVERGRGHVVNVASAASFVGPPGEAMYGATKHAVRGLSEAVREELRGSGVNLTVVFPGLVQTELAAGTQPNRGGRWIGPERVGEAIADVIARPRAEVFVPREIAFLLRLYASLPTRPRQMLARAFGLDRVATRVDPATRTAYAARIKAGPPGAGTDDADADS
jgi:NAD(P)-dependent dehydrogenase (short-subunit alcohol dehydrogenase family)